MRHFKRKLLTNSLIILYWIISISLLSFISISSIRSYLELGGMQPDMDNEITKYWLSPNQYLESLLFGIFFGLLFILVNRMAKKLRIEELGFGKSVLMNSGIYFVGFIVIIALVYQIIGIFGFYNEFAFIPIATNKTVIGLISVIIGVIIIQILFLNFIIQSMEIMGDYNLIRFLTGKYKTPFSEDRAFMFLDLRGSTRHAERLGDVMYSEMIRDCFRDLNYLLNKHEAEIYQYVGDEVVLTWTTTMARENHRIFAMYFAFEKALQDRSEHYISKYGELPVFKAGCNSGFVTAAEIGIIKRDIAFHGDVINTASRIQDMCNPLDQILITTKPLLNENIQNFSLHFVSLGEHNLKGKHGMTELFGVRPKP